MSTKAAVEDILPVHKYRINRKIGFFLGPIVFMLMLLSDAPGGLTPEAWKVLSVAALMSIWWISEAIPLTATAFAPLILFPFLDVMDLRDTAQPYASPIIFLFLGGFMIALAMQKWKLHLRIALNIVKIIGTQPDKMVAGFMISAAFLSMWISNTATIMMMLPLTLAVIELLNDGERYAKIDPQLKKNFAVSMMLGICYSVSIGGMGTVIGTPPNAFFKGFMTTNYDFDMAFIDWMVIGVPFSVVMVFVCWFLLTKVLFPLRGLEFADSDKLIKKEIKSIGPISKGESLTAVICVLTACGWVFQSFIKDFIPGASDAWVAMLGCVLLFIVPVSFKQGIFLMRWEDTKNLPWGVLFLFGGGLGLAGGFREVELDQWIGSQVGGLGDVSLLVMILIVITTVLFLTEIMSNIATTTILVPVFAAAAIGLGENPLLLTIPATMAASCGFMMPVATAANAIIFGTGHVRMRQMFVAGFIMNILSLALIVALVYFLVIPEFGIVRGELPDWAVQSK